MLTSVVIGLAVFAGWLGLLLVLGLVVQAIGVERIARWLRLDIEDER